MGADPIGFLSDLAGLADGPVVDKPSNDEEAARQFEGMVLKMVLKEMRKSLDDGGLFGGSEGAMYQDWFDGEIARRIADGGGLGLAAKLDLGQLEHGVPVHLGERQKGLFPVAGEVSSRFGHRADPFGGAHRSHHGIDIAAAEGTPIRSVRDGTVTFAGESGGYGNLVVVDHGDGLESRYAHCRAVSVREGETVQAGSLVGSVGSTGRSTGPHLHFEVRQGGRPVDPASVLSWEEGP